MCFICKFFRSLNFCSSKKIKINIATRLLMLMPYLDLCRIGNFLPAQRSIGRIWLYFSSVFIVMIMCLALILEHFI